MAPPRSTPPQLDGYEFVQGLGGGGFADVFLYRQLRPSRQVAVKVMLPEHVSAEGIRQFESEADLMAEVSDHPHIVTVFNADVAGDGRPFIVMEYCPQATFGERARGGRMPVAESLQVSIQVSSAVHAAHQAGILHRDIKPANILTNAYGAPALTDFGIAGVQRAGQLESARGVSYGYAAPEVVTDPDPYGSVVSDVYSLGATVYSLLAGRSPYWIPAGDNTQRALVSRILSGPPPPTGRSDVPRSLEGVLAQTLASDPSTRPQNAEAFARLLQDVEQELHLNPTALVGARQVGRPTAPVPDDDIEGTVRGRVSVVDPDGRPSPGTGQAARADRPPPQVAPQSQPQRADLGSDLDDDPKTTLREGQRAAGGRTESDEPDPAIAPVLPGDDPPASDADNRQRVPRAVVAGAAALLMVVIAIGVIALGGGDGSDDARDTSADTTDDDQRAPITSLLPAAAPNPPSGVTLTVDGEDLTITIAEPSGTDSSPVAYVVARADGTPWPGGERLTTDRSTVTVSGIEDLDEGTLCVDVYSRSGNLLSPVPASGCLPR